MLFKTYNLHAMQTFSPPASTALTSLCLGTGSGKANMVSSFSLSFLLTICFWVSFASSVYFDSRWRNSFCDWFCYHLSTLFFRPQMLILSLILLMCSCKASMDTFRYHSSIQFLSPGSSVIEFLCWSPFA